MRDEITILAAEDRTLTKTWTLQPGDSWTKTGFSAGKWFQHEPSEVGSIKDLSELLTKLEKDPHRFIIRGQLRRGPENGLVRRNKSEEDAFFEAHPQGRRWVCIDIDELPIPDPSDSASPEQGVQYAIGVLPECFHDVSFHYQWSSSAGFEKSEDGSYRRVESWAKLRLHLWFWLDKQLHDDQAQVWLRQIDNEVRAKIDWEGSKALVDPALGRTVQAHYVAAPIFEGGEDPLKNRRSGLVRGGSNEVVVPALPPPEKRRRSRVESCGPFLPTERERLQSALTVLLADIHDDWIAVGMAIHSKHPGDEGLDLWDSWSRKSDEYQDREDLEARWKTFGVDRGRTIQLVYDRAKKEGWEDPLEIQSEWYTKPRSTLQERSTIQLGEIVRKTIETKKDEEVSQVVSHLGSDIFPIGVSQPVDDDEAGVLVECRNEAGKRVTAAILASKLTDIRGMQIAGSELAGSGVQICTGKGSDLVSALGSWRDRTGPPVIKTVSRCGWHRNRAGWVFVNGVRILGADDWEYTGPKYRSKRGGSLNGWVEAIASLAITHGAVVALGMALAAPLPQRLGRDNFSVHFFGSSSTGKTLIAKLAASAWYDPIAGMLTWNGTANGLENEFHSFAGAVVILDEIKHCSPWYAANLIHRLGDGKGRIRSKRTGDANLPQRKFRLTAISTGENSVADYLGNHTQGGHLVRMIDIPVEVGEACHDKKHAAEIERFLNSRVFGTAGDAWVEYLCSRDDKWWAELKDDRQALEDHLRSTLGVDPPPEAGRVAGHLALVGVALDRAVEADILPIDIDDADQAVEWAFRGHIRQRGSLTCPEARGADSLYRSILTQPNLWPEEDTRKSVCTLPLLGIRAAAARKMKNSHEATDAVYTSEAHLKCATFLKDAGCGVRNLFKWLKKKGVGTPPDGQSRKDGIKASWWRIDIEELGTAVGHLDTKKKDQPDLKVIPLSESTPDRLSA